MGHQTTLGGMWMVLQMGPGMAYARAHGREERLPPAETITQPRPGRGLMAAQPRLDRGAAKWGSIFFLAKKGYRSQKRINPFDRGRGLIIRP
jgi:hypothetical protein